MQLSKIAKILGAKLVGEDRIVDFPAISTDTRTLHPGQLFVALQGPHFNGHDFISTAVDQGASAAIVSQTTTCSCPLLIVADTYSALRQLAAHHRAQFDPKVIGITGSFGKTTTRAITQQILKQQHCVLASVRSFNNTIGLPLTLFQLAQEHKFVVLEMGANHPGEISSLTKIAKPHLALITNAGPAHLSGFKTLSGVARAKGEIFEGLSPTGMGVINSDDPQVEFWNSLLGSTPQMRFGLHHEADVTADRITYNQRAQPTFRLILPQSKLTIQLPLMGEHNIYNALAAATVGVAYGISPEAIKIALESMQPVQKRLVEFVGYAGATVIDDSYNANPASVSAAMEILARRGGESFLVLGDMAELGEDSENMHREMGQRAALLGISRLYCYGSYTQHTVHAFGKTAYHFDSQADLLEYLKKDLHPGVTVLVKGSLVMKMGTIVDALSEKPLVS